MLCFFPEMLFLMVENWSLCITMAFWRCFSGNLKFFKCHHMFEALEWNKFSNQYWGRGRIRMGKCCLKASAVQSWSSNKAHHLLWEWQEINHSKKKLSTSLFEEIKSRMALKWDGKLLFACLHSMHVFSRPKMHISQYES